MKGKKKINLKQKMKKINKGGFTLVELLAIIVLTAVVLGIGTYGVIHLVNNSKTGATRISMNSIKESASIYSDEDSSRWIEPYNDDYSYFCTTIGELINKGIIKKNATLPNGIDRDKYVSIKKNKVTLVKGEAVILASENNSSEEDENEKNKMSSICEGNNIIEPDAEKPNIKGAESYTDSLSVSFEDGKAPNSEIKDKWCQYDTKSSFDDTKFSFEDGKNVIVLDRGDTNCVIGNLKNNSDYYVRVCMTTTGGSRLCDTSDYSTAEFKNITFSYSESKATIEYNDDKVKKPSHYFKSNVSAESTTSVYECDDNFNCDSTTKTISKDKWYKTLDNKVVIDYDKSDGTKDGIITARIADGSNNSKEFKDEFSLYKVVFKVGSADSIDNKTSDISKRCIAKRGESCNISSPSIKKDCYTGMGWSTSNNANSSSWSPGASKSISSSGTYYPTNGNKTTYTVSYNANGGSGAPDSQTKTCKVDLTLRSTKPSRSNYTFEGWSSSSNGSAGYYPGGIYKDDKNITLYAVWEEDVYSLTLSKNSGVSRIYYREGTSGSYTSSSSTVSINNITSGTKYYYYGTAYSGYEMNSCTSSSPCSVTVTSNVSRTLYASATSTEDDTYMFTLSRGTGVDKMYYRKGSSGSYTQTSGYSVLITSIDYGTTYYYYGTASSGYTMDSCTSSSPCSVRITSDITRTLSASSSSSGGSSSGGSSTKTYTVNYNANGGSGAPSSQTKYEGTNLTLSSTIPTRSGYTFKGWNTSSSATSVQYYSGDTYTANASVTLYAVWEANSSSTKTYTITYHANGSNVTGLPASQTKEHGKSIKLSSSKPTRPTYEFYGWSESSSATSATWGAGGTIYASVNRNLDLYAVWHDPISPSYDNIDGYRCSNGNKYYITKCTSGTSGTCNYTEKNGSSSSGTINRSDLKSCKPTISVNPTGTSYCSGQKITLSCSTTSGMSIKEAKIVDNGDTTFGTAYLNTLRNGNIATVFTCTTNAGDSDSKTIYYTITNCSSGGSGSSCNTKVKCAASKNSSTACMNLANSAGAYTYTYDGKGTCYGQFCSSSCPSGSTWTYVNKIV